MDKPIVNILWTGGWDSTYRVVQLSMMEVAIQPIYVEDVGRKSVSYELQAMKDIESLLEAKAETKAEFLPLKVIKITEIPKDDEITGAYNRIRELVSIGTQYDFLARLAKLFMGIELGIEKPNGEYSGCVAAIQETGKLISKDGVYIVDSENSSKDCNLVFGNFSFPIIEIDEIKMLDNIKKWNYESVMKHIWFCHNPIDDLPCGYCRPCQQKMECGMEWLIPIKGRKRYKFYSSVSRIFGKKLGNRTSNLVYRR